MIKILTNNLAKYTLFSEYLDKLSISLIKSDFEIPELQGKDFNKVLEYKAKWAFDNYGGGTLVDDTALFLEEYPDFPGVYTKFILSSLGKEGMSSLLHKKSKKAVLKCKIGCWNNGKLYQVEGAVKGILDFSKKVDSNSPGPLSTWFIPQETTKFGSLEHRYKAIMQLGELINLIN